MKSDLKAWLAAIGFAVLSLFVFFQVYHRPSPSLTRDLYEHEAASPDITSATAVSNPGKFRVTKFHDGDTCEVVGSDGIHLTIRLAGIDAPELAQEFGHEAKDLLESLIGTQNVSLSEVKYDKYGRFLAQVYCGHTWINKELLLRGAAWVYLADTHYGEFTSAEAVAKSKRLGLWSLSNPKPPWEARK